MINFLNNGGMEAILGGLFLTYVIVKMRKEEKLKKQLK